MTHNDEHIKFDLEVNKQKTGRRKKKSNLKIKMGEAKSKSFFFFEEALSFLAIIKIKFEFSINDLVNETK
jgi:hypothetical protein